MSDAGPGKGTNKERLAEITAKYGGSNQLEYGVRAEVPIYEDCLT